jgi:hypothetical protein
MNFVHPFELKNAIVQYGTMWDSECIPPYGAHRHHFLYHMVYSSQ